MGKFGKSVVLFLWWWVLLFFLLKGWAFAGDKLLAIQDNLFRAKFIVTTTSDWTNIQLLSGEKIVNIDFHILEGEKTSGLSITTGEKPLYQLGLGDKPFSLQKGPITKKSDELELSMPTHASININKRSLDTTRVKVEAIALLTGLKGTKSIDLRIEKGGIGHTEVEIYNYNSGKPYLIKSATTKKLLGDSDLSFSLDSKKIMDRGPIQLNPLEVSRYEKLVLAYYYIWFNEGSWRGEDPFMGRSLSDINPMVGQYISSDPKVIEQHIKFAKQADIDGFIISWWQDPALNNIVESIINIAGKDNFKICFDLEVLGKRPDQIYEMLLYIFQNYRYAENIIKIDGKIVFFIWGTWEYPPKTWQEMFNKLKRKGYDGIYLPSENTSPWYLSTLNGLTVYGTIGRDLDSLYRQLYFYHKTRFLLDRGRKPYIWTATISPGYDERLIPGRKGNYQEREDGNYYVSTFKVALASDPDWLVINSFNELAEYSHIEPTKEFGYKYLNLTKEFAQQFKGRELKR